MPGAEEFSECLSEEAVRVAREELGEDPLTREQQIQTVRQWLVRQPQLNARTDRRTILRYLRGCKFSEEKTQKKLEVYYTCKGAMPEMFQGRDPLDPKIREIAKMGLMFPLPGYDHHGRKVIFGRLGAWNPTKVRPEDLFRAASMLFDVLFLEDEQTTITGIVQANDMSDLTFQHVTALPLPLMRKVFKTWQEGYPLRPKSVHYINTPSAFDTLFTLFRPFMREKMKKRIHIHGRSLQKMYNYVPREMLPIEYGGTAGTVRELSDYWLAKLDEHRNWFLEDEKYAADPKRRKTKSTLSSILGGGGGRSEDFKTLEFD